MCRQKPSAGVALRIPVQGTSLMIDGSRRNTAEAPAISPPAPSGIFRLGCLKSNRIGFGSHELRVAHAAVAHEARPSAQGLFSLLWPSPDPQHGSEIRKYARQAVAIALDLGRLLHKSRSCFSKART